MDVAAYLERIGYKGSLVPNLRSLSALQEAHLIAVPFENLDIHLGRPITLDEAALFDKIVRQRRGGVCFELNGLFAGLLREMGFRVTLLGASVYDGRNGDFGPPNHHLTLMVELEERWLVDVGFGDSFRTPLLFGGGAEPAEDASGRAYWVKQYEGCWQMEWHGDGRWQPGYRFTLEPRQLSDFGQAAKYIQYSPESHFKQREVCTRATADGRVTVVDKKLTVSHGQERIERILSQYEYRPALVRYFDLELAEFTHDTTLFSS